MIELFDCDELALNEEYANEEQKEERMEGKQQWRWKRPGDIEVDLYGTCFRYTHKNEFESIELRLAQASEARRFL